MSNFISEMKSTIDKTAVDAAIQLGGPGALFVDLDDTLRSQEILSSEEDVLVWEVLSMDEAPSDPLWTVMFAMGAKTTIDPGRYSMMDMLSHINAVMPKGSSIDVIDYTPDGDGATKTGSMYITDVRMDNQMYDRQSGIRMILVAARAVRGG